MSKTNFLGSVNNVIYLHHTIVLQILSVWHGNISSSYSFWGSIKIIKCVCILEVIKILRSLARLTSSEPTPKWVHPSSTVTSLPVLRTEETIVLTSRGRMLRKFTTSAEIPCVLSAAAALIQFPTCLEKEMMVTSVPKT